MLCTPIGSQPIENHNSVQWLTRSLNSSFQTPVFEILAGPSEEVFYAHAGFLAKSEIVEKGIAGRFVESQERKIRWPQWSADIVDKFLQWLYTGDYAIPLPMEYHRAKGKRAVKLDLDGPAVNETSRDTQPTEDFPYDLQEREWAGTAATEPVESEFAEPVPVPEREEPTLPAPPPKAPSSSLPASMFPAIDIETIAIVPLTPLKDLEWKGSHPVMTESRAGNFNEWMDQRDKIQRYDYGVTLMTHATLYVIACEKDLHELKNMAWQRLRSLLIKIGAPVQGKPVLENLVTLIHYAYRETGISELPVDPLRDLLTSYVAIHFTKFRGPEVDSLFASKGADDREFVVDLMAKVRQSMEHFEATADNNNLNGFGGWGQPSLPTKKKKKGKVIDDFGF